MGNFKKSDNITFYTITIIVGILLFLLFNKSDWGKNWMEIVTIVLTVFVCWIRFELNRAIEIP
jgi:uncharacterized protein YqhQ